MIEFIYTYGDIIQFIVYVLNALAVGAAAVIAACFWVKYVNRITACCAGDKTGHGHHGYHAIHGYHGAKSECCSDAPESSEAPAESVDVSKFVD